MKAIYKTIILIIILSSNSIHVPIYSEFTEFLEYGYTNLHVPIYSEFTEFLEYDYTNLHVYDNDINKSYNDRYVCSHFSRDLIASAKNSGYKMYPTTVINASSGSGHMLTAIRMDDSWIFIEPQNDMIFTMDELHVKYGMYDIDILKNVIITSDGVELYPLQKI